MAEKKQVVIGKKDLVDRIASVVNENAEKPVSKKVLGDIIDAFTDIVSTEVEKGSLVRLIGFGTFEKKATSARKGRNPQTGAVIDIPAHERLGFKSSVKY